MRLTRKPHIKATSATVIVLYIRFVAWSLLPLYGISITSSEHIGPGGAVAGNES
jgi:hypothetical protein